MSDSIPPQPSDSSSDKANPYASPINDPAPATAFPQQEGDATGGVIPYKNPKALIAYYLGILSLLIFPLGFASVPLGILGLRDRKRNPAIKGSVHAWIGIVLGTLSVLCGGFIVVMFIIGASREF